ncbi:MAG: GNAT family N-acetyltransferase [Anaerolineae bacterium]|nr:GNAT family N-acetyltransferase [Anaerolineae bacterium]
MNPVTIRILQPGDEADLETFLLPRLESSMFLIGNMRAVGLNDNGQRYAGTYAAVFADGQIVGIVAHYWNQNLVVQAPLNYLDGLCRAAVEASKRSLKGIVGPVEQVRFIQESFQIDQTNIQMGETEKLYSLNLPDLITPEALVLGRVCGRRIEPRDVDLITAWRIAYSLKTLEEQDSPDLRASCRTAIERSLAEQTTWVLEDQGRPVACSSFNTAIKEVVQVGGVWTPPELRRRGYGRCAVAVSLLDARAEGVKKAILFTPHSNTPAQKAYEALGFQSIGDYCIVLLKSPLQV